MGRFLNSFLEFKNEATATRKFALFAVVIITFGLISLSVTGIIATAEWTFLSFFPIVGMILAVIGAELMATVAFVRALAAPTLKRKIAGYAISLGLAWVGVHNAENGAKVIWPDRFAESSSTLAARARLAGEEAGTLGTAQQAAIDSTGGELERVRTQIAELKTEQQVMASMSPEGISKAQSLLLAQGLYFGSVDGIRQDKTESAMRARGEAIQGELATLKAREDGLMAGQASPVQQATTDKRVQEIEWLALAEAAFWSGLWLAVMLWTLESCRSLGLWALVTDMTGADVNRDRSRAEELADAEHKVKLAAIRASIARVAPPPAPVAEEPPPAPAVEPPVAVEEPEPLILDEPAPEPVKPTPGRPGGLSTQHINRASSLEDVILVEDNRERNAARDSERLVA